MLLTTKHGTNILALASFLYLIQHVVRRANGLREHAPEMAWLVRHIQGARVAHHLARVMKALELVGAVLLRFGVIQAGGRGARVPCWVQGLRVRWVGTAAIVTRSSSQWSIVVADRSVKVLLGATTRLRYR